MVEALFSNEGTMVVTDIRLEPVAPKRPIGSRYACRPGRATSN
jgi:hypothetical protein